MKRLIIGVICLIGFTTYAVPQHQCDLRAMHKQLVDNYGLAEWDAHAYTLAFENFLVNLDLQGIRFGKSVYKGDLQQIKYKLMVTFDMSEQDAEYIVTTMKLVRMISMKHGVGSTDEYCTGVW